MTEDRPDWGKIAREGAAVAAQLYVADDDVSLGDAINKAAFKVHGTAKMIERYLAGVGARVLCKDASDDVFTTCGQCEHWGEYDTSYSSGWCKFSGKDGIRQTDSCDCLEERLDKAIAETVALSDAIFARSQNWRKRWGDR